MLLCYYESLRGDCTVVYGMRLKMHGWQGVRRVLAECAGAVCHFTNACVSLVRGAGVGLRIFRVHDWLASGGRCALGVQVEEVAGKLVWCSSLVVRSLFYFWVGVLHQERAITVLSVVLA